jgi:catechol 2,3-dioxygenase-like lactoylglutathione lyase family enzyme
MVLGLDHVGICIPVGGEDVARKFYSEVLGLREVPKPGTISARGGIWYLFPDGRMLHLLAYSNFKPAPRAHPAFIADLNALAAKTEPKWDTELAPRRRFYLTDPFGNRLEFLEDETAGEKLTLKDRILGHW